MPHPSDLLGALPRLLQLQQLNMMGCFGGRHPPVRVAALSAALRPLTQLTALDISNIALTDESDAAPAGVWEQGGQGLRSTRQHLFASLLLPRLQMLGVSGMWDCTPGTPLFSAADLGHLVVACPVLTWLRMWHSISMESGRDLSSLTVLSGKTWLLPTPVVHCDVLYCTAVHTIGSGDVCQRGFLPSVASGAGLLDPW
jgi:hypothetical protein